MKDLFRRFMYEEEGMGTVEVIIIIAVLVGVALLFRKKLIEFVNGIINNLFPDSSSLENNKAGSGGSLGN